MNDIVRELQIESDVAKTLLANIRDVIGDDEQAAADAIEGETSFNEAVLRAVDRLSDIEAMTRALKESEEQHAARRKRLETQADCIRAAIIAAMGQAGLKKIEVPLATLSLKTVPPKALVINEAEIPSEFWKRQDPKLDTRAVLAALKDGHTVPGATLSNGSETVQIRWS